jgi:hypothetical protein
MSGDFWWIASLIAAAGLLIAVWINFIRPWLRHLRLRRPVHAHFTIRNSRQSLSGRDVSMGDPHLVRRLTLPAKQTSVIELGLLPRIPIQVNQIVIAFGDSADAPTVLKRIYQYVRSGARPSTEKDYTGGGGSYHAVVDRKYNVGTHYVMGFKVQTRGAGLYPVSLELITDEVEGKHDGLEILVEDAPNTVMHCHKKTHGRNCLVRPITRRQPRSRAGRGKSRKK